MHERKMFEDFMKQIEAVARQENATRVTVVRAKIGALSHLTPEHFREHFLEASRGRLAEGARIEVETIPGITHPLARDLVLDSLDLES